jgi:hypothetical protein
MRITKKPHEPAESIFRDHSSQSELADGSLSFCCGFLARRIEQTSQFLGGLECTPDIIVIGAAVESEQFGTMRALHLKAGANPLGPLSKYPRALGAFYFDLFVDHDSVCLVASGSVSFSSAVEQRSGGLIVASRVQRRSRYARPFRDDKYYKQIVKEE